MAKLKVIIYSRPGCHLCDEAKEVIEGARCREEFVFEEINIDSNPELLDKYKYDIPVITINDVECFIHRVDATEFCTRIRRIRG